MNFCYVSRLLSSILRLYLVQCSFHSPSSSCVPYLLNLFPALCACFRRSDSSFLHHLLLKGHMSARGVVSAVAHLMAVLMSLASWFTVSIVGCVKWFRIRR